MATLRFPKGDLRELFGQIAVRLARRVDETGALPAAVRELRVLLAQLAEVPGREPTSPYARAGRIAAFFTMLDTAGVPEINQG